jgi:hypothetical protein
MAESYTTAEVDNRTFGLQQQRLLNDLNRPDLSGVVIEFLQDAMRHYARMPFFFNDTDNNSTAAWVASTVYPQGATATFVDSGDTYLIAALNQGTSGLVQPTFTTDIFQVPSGTNGAVFPPPVSGTAGTTDDNGGSAGAGIIWGTITNMTSNDQTVDYWTQLTTVYNIGQYVPPIDYVAPRLVEITIPNIRIPLIELSYPELRSYDVIRPNVVSSYPAWWSWYQQKIYVYPYPQAFYPLTLSYRSAPAIPTQAQQSNIWTTKAEQLVRAYAEGLIQERVLKDPEAAQLAFSAAERSFTAIRSQSISQQVIMGIPSSDW